MSEPVLSGSSFSSSSPIRDNSAPSLKMSCSTHILTPRILTHTLRAKLMLLCLFPALSVAVGFSPTPEFPEGCCNPASLALSHLFPPLPPPPQYADPVTDLLDQCGVFRTRLFRESCVFHQGCYVKDLSRLGRDLHKTLILDNSPASYIFHPHNAVSQHTPHTHPDSFLILSFTLLIIKNHVKC